MAVLGVCLLIGATVAGGSTVLVMISSHLVGEDDVWLCQLRDVV